MHRQFFAGDVVGINAKGLVWRLAKLFDAQFKENVIHCRIADNAHFINPVCIYGIGDAEFCGQFIYTVDYDFLQFS